MGRVTRRQTAGLPFPPHTWSSTVSDTFPVGNDRFLPYFFARRSRNVANFSLSYDQNIFKLVKQILRHVGLRRTIVLFTYVHKFIAS